MFLRCGWSLVQQRRPGYTRSLPVLVDGWSPNSQDVVIPFFSSDGFSSVVSVTLVLVLLSYWNELVHLHTSQSSYL